MPISFNREVGKSRKQYSLYTKEEIDRLFSKSQRLTERGSSTSSGGGGSSSPIGHTHVEADITDLDHYTDADLENHIVGAGAFQTLGTGDDVQFNTLTLNGVPLFDLAKEQNLSDDATGVSFGDLTLVSGDFGTDNFTSGWQGSGHRSTYAGDLEAESIFLRGGLTVNELILNKLRYQDGGLIIGAGGGKVSSVTGSAGSETVVFEDPEGNTNLPFTVGAIIMLQDFDLDRTTVVKKIVREVDTITTDEITLTTTTGWTTGDDVGSIAQGDEMVAIGHTTDTNLDAFIYMSAVDQNNPFLRVMDGVDTYNKFTLGSETGLRVQLGNLNGLAGFTSDIFGLYAKDNVVIEINGGSMMLGKDVGASNEDGIFINSNNYWYDTGLKKFGGASQYVVWDGSTVEVVGDITAENLVINSNFNLGNKMTVEAGGEITNAADSFLVSDQGFFVRGNTGSAAEAYKFYDTGNSRQYGEVRGRPANYVEIRTYDEEIILSPGSIGGAANPAKRVEINAQTNLNAISTTIDGDLLRIADDTATIFTVAGEGNVDDDLVGIRSRNSTGTVNHGESGDFIIIKANADDVITIKDGVGNIVTGAGDRVLSGDRVGMLVNIGGTWHLLWSSSNM